MRRPSPAFVVACLALLVALTGTSYATVLNVPKNSVGTAELKRNAVKPAKLAPNAVRTAHVLNGSLLSADFRAGQIPQGPKGDKGDKGDTGAVGVSGLELVESSTSSSTGDVKQGVASCPAGKRVLGGGGRAPSTVAIWMSRPADNGTQWIAGGREVSDSGSWAMTAWAVCASVP
jgi:hypothetical protein